MSFAINFGVSFGVGFTISFAVNFPPSFAVSFAISFDVSFRIRVPLIFFLKKAWMWNGGNFFCVSFFKQTDILVKIVVQIY